MEVLAIAIGSDNLVTLSPLKDQVSSSYVNNATASAVLSDLAGTTVTTISLSYVAASNGIYQGIVPAAVTALLTEGKNYNITATATGSGVTFLERKLGVANYYNG